MVAADGLERMPNLRMIDYLAGYAAGSDAMASGVVDLPNNAPRSRWWRFGWLVGRLAARERRSPADLGRFLRSCGQPIEANPWLRDTPSGMAFEEGWRA
ncbi:hypothetical protein [Azospirillum picis]|uniref:Uncharacterized protein n=1 Tax=Azospirillum picis TaxID=488438 RepID=A0ABU0MUI9_9PROT|nr:hypothetical protein [Azospirillum picis]MBP2303305.1 hypothetical protein [Azospirillum picis]MDQ0537155.1 hypothetical protein [Azospirillum picis]